MLRREAKPPEFVDFLPFGRRLRADNHWVKLATPLPGAMAVAVRNAVDGKFGEVTRRFCLGRLMAKLQVTCESVAGCAIFCANLTRREAQQRRRLFARVVSLHIVCLCLPASRQPIRCMRHAAAGRGSRNSSGTFVLPLFSASPLSGRVRLRHVAGNGRRSGGQPPPPTPLPAELASGVVIVGLPLVGV